MAPLNYINYLNVAASCIIAMHTLDIDLGPEFDFFDKFNMRDFFRTFEEGSFTPSEPFFLFFSIIAMFLMIFAVVQVLPAYRSSPMVQEGVQYWYFAGTVVQLFANRLADEADDSFVRRFFSTLFYGLVVGSLWKILDNQARAKTVSDNSAEEFWLLRFPFSLQAAWVTAITIMSANVLFIGEEEGFTFSSFMHGLVVFVSLIVYAGLSVKLLLFNNDSPNYTIPAVFSFFAFGIAINSGNEEGTWASLAFLGLMSLISFGSAAGTAFLIYKNEYKNSASNDAVHPLSENSYQGDEMAATNSKGSETTMV